MPITSPAPTWSPTAVTACSAPGAGGELMADNGQNTEDVYERVRNAILDGQLAPGAVMSQVALAQDLGISRTPLREALRMLQSEGLVEGEPNRRVRVAPMTASDLE